MDVPSQLRVWQIAGGSTDRTYAAWFVRYGVALLGPGDPGCWTADRSDEDYGGSFIRRFASDVKIGDLLLLRTGVSNVKAIGLVASDYVYLEQFDDVNGWDLQHGRRIRWLEFDQEHIWNGRVFGAQPPRFSETGNQEIIDFARRFLQSEPSHWQESVLPALPPPEPLLETVPSELAPLIAEVRDLASLYQDKKRFDERLPKEDELLAHFVVPFFKALGWPTELIGIKWHDIDVVLFRELPRTPENVHFVIEVKRIGAGIEGALEQAKAYVRGLAVPRDIVVTDGIRYRLYSAEKEFAPVHYANLGWLKQRGTHLFEAVRRQR